MLLVDARGAPLSIIVTGANRHDVTQLATTLDSIRSSSAPGSRRITRRTCARMRALAVRLHTDRWWSVTITRTCALAAQKRCAAKKGYPPRRWIVEEKQGRRKKLVNLAQGCAARTYAQWEEYCRAFDRGHFQLDARNARRNPTSRNLVRAIEAPVSTNPRDLQYWKSAYRCLRLY
jgi:hypothetical protein